MCAAMLAMGVALALSAGGPVHAAPPDAAALAIARFDPADAAFAPLYALERSALALDIDHATPAQLPALRVAWTALLDRALAVRVPGTTLPHPLAGRALVQLALVEQMSDDYRTAARHAERGTALLAPFRDRYAQFYAHGRTLLGFFRFAEGNAAAAVDILAPNVAFVQAYHDGLPPERRTKEFYVIKADGEYALGQALARTGQVERAAAMQQRSAASLASALGPDDGTVLVAQTNYANLLSRAGKRAEAEQVARAAVERTIAHVPRADPSYARVLSFTGLMMSRNGRRQEGLDYISTALAAMREAKTASPLGTLQIEQAYGANLIELERYADALPVLGSASAGFARLESPFDVRKARSLVGLAHFAEGASAPAATELTAAVADAPDARTREVAQVALPPLVLASADLGRRDTALAHAQAFAALARASEGPKAFLTADADALLAYLGMSGGAKGIAAAGAAARRLVAVVGDNRTLALDGELPVRDRGALDLALRIAVQAHDPQLALAAMTVLAGSRIATANHLIVDRLVTADPVLGGRVRALDDAVRAFQRSDDAYVAALGAAGAGKDVALRRDERAAAAAVVAAVRAGMARDFPRWTEARGAERVDLAELQRGLRAGEALLGVVPALDGVYLLAVDRRGAQVERMALTRAQAVALVARVRASLPAGAFDTAASHALYRGIFTPAIRRRLGSARSLRIVATGAFAALPFPTLLRRPVARIDRTAPWLIRDYALRITPGFGLDLARQSRAAVTQRVLAIGAPQPFGAAVAIPVAAPVALREARRYFRGGTGDAQALSSLPALPGSADEIHRIARALGSARTTVLLGTEADEARIRTMDLSPYGIVIFATHGLVSGEMEGVTEPALVLAAPHDAGRDASFDGLLVASEIGILRLNADWVILSACNTATGDAASGQWALAAAYSGLATAFRYAGARSLLVSHWPVRDDAAAAITVATVRGTRRGLSREVALQRAMLKTIANRSIQDGGDPFVWAPFVLLD